MSLSPQQLSTVQGVLHGVSQGDAKDGAPNALAAVRAALPGLVASRCDSEDMRGESPYWRGDAYAFFLVDTSAHCWRVVDDPDLASGVVITQLT